ncbi:MAG: type II secretion system protein [Bacillota bacterium]|nr:type II secretion system protein [Bacillota bacterium]
MWKLRIKKGFTLVETVIALSIFALIMASVFSVEAVSVNERAINRKLDYYIDCMEAASSTIIANNGYDTLKSLSSASQWYINEDNLKFEALTSSNVISLLETSTTSGSSNMKIQVSGSKVLIITFQINFTFKGKVESITHEAYKGNYN